MSLDRHKRVQEIFVAVVDLPHEQWPAELAARCDGDASMLDEVRSLLGFHDKADQFLDAREIHVHGLDALPPEEVLKTGSRIGEYTIQRLVGAGGMGHVYIAEQGRPRRTVALKVIRRGVASESLLRRFEHEAEMLGRLQHPGIAQIYEAGAAVIDPVRPAQPFIAMELVNGPSLTAYADLHRCDMRSRLELIAKVCDAVHHAHQRGVIHRDLKPANILVGEDGHPKVLDFGVARAADADLRVTTLHTSVGQLIGTLPYMSPEQVVGDPAELDTRSDVYALGVVTYELLTERLPYELKSRALPDAVRLIRDEPPARMSSLDKTLRGDVDTIVSKALAKDKARRYQSAAELAADIRAFLDGLPIAARQDSALYVLRKQMRRHKALVAAAAIMLLGILVFSVYAIVQASTSRLLEKAARDAQAAAENALVEVSQKRVEAQQQLASSIIERGRLLAVSGNPSAAEDLLWPEYLKDLGQRRTFFALWELYSRSRCEATLMANRPQVSRVRTSPNGKYVATSGVDPGVMVWETNTLERLSAFGATGVEHSAIAFSPESTLIVGDRAGRVSEWDPHTGRELTCFIERGPAVVDVGVSHGGDVVVLGLARGELAMLDRTSRSTEPRVLKRWHLPKVRVISLACNPHEDEVAIGCSDGHIRVISIPDAEPLLQITDVDDLLPRVNYSPEGTMIAACGRSQGTRVWNARSGQRLHQFRAPNGAIRAAEFSPDGKRLVAIGWWWVQVWDVEQEKLIESFSHRGGAGEVAFAPDGKHIWASQDSTLRSWEIDPTAGQTRLNGAAESRSLARFTRDGKLLVGDRDGSVRLISATDGTQIAKLGSLRTRVRSISLSPTEPLATAITWDGTIGLFDLQRREHLATWGGYRASVYTGGGFDSKGRRLAVPTRENGFRVLEIPSGRVLLDLPHRKDSDEALAAVFSPDDRLLAMSSRRGGLWLCDADTGQHVRDLERASGTPWSVVFSPDGSKIASGTWARTIDVWDVRTGKLERRLDGHRGLVTDLAFRPNEPSILASSGADGRVMLWDLSIQENTPVLTLDGFDGWEVWSVSFDFTGLRLVATNSPGTSVVWNLRYFNRHIGGNMPAKIEQYREMLGDRLNVEAAVDQVRLLLNRGGKAKVRLPTDDPEAVPR